MDDRYVSPKEWAVRQLHRRIMSGQYPPHTMLPPERRLSEELGLSRGYIRLALAALEQQGLVKRMRGRGTQVLAPHERPSPYRVASVHPRFETCRLSSEALALYAGLTARLKAHGYTADQLFYYDRDTPPRPGEELGKMVPVSEIGRAIQDYDAVVFQEIPCREVVEAALELERRRRPVVVANLEVDQPVSGTRVDHRAIFRQATQVLIGYGHRRIAFIGRDPSLLFYGRALEGFREALEAAGLAVDESLVAFTPLRDSLGGYVAVQPLLQRPDRPTAVVAARDVLAQGVCYAIERAGLRVGYDVSVIGFDNLSWPCDDPILTTFEEPAYDMGAAAVDMLVERMMHGWRAPEQRELEARLVLRRSVGPPPLASAEGSPPADTVCEGAAAR